MSTNIANIKVKRVNQFQDGSIGGFPLENPKFQFKQVPLNKGGCLLYGIKIGFITC